MPGAQKARKHGIHVGVSKNGLLLMKPRNPVLTLRGSWEVGAMAVVGFVEAPHFLGEHLQHPYQNSIVRVGICKHTLILEGLLLNLSNNIIESTLNLGGAAKTQVTSL